MDTMMIMEMEIMKNKSPLWALEIADKTGASTATISRVNRSLNYGSDGYDMVFSRLQVDCGTGEPENKE